MPVIANLADEIIRLVEINRRTINGLDYGILMFRVFKGQPIEITARRVVKFVPSQVLKADLNDGYVPEDELSAEDEDAGMEAPDTDDDDDKE